MVRLLTALAVLLVAASAHAQSFPVPGSGGSSGGASTGAINIRTPGACASNETDVTTTFAGLFLAGMPTGGTLAGTLGTPFADLANATLTPTGTNATSTVTPLGTVASHTHSYDSVVDNSAITPAAQGIDINGAGANWFVTTTAGGAATVTLLKGAATLGTAPAFTGSSSTVAAQTFTGAAITTARSTVAPFIQVRFCSKT